MPRLLHRIYRHKDRLGISSRTSRQGAKYLNNRHGMGMGTYQARIVIVRHSHVLRKGTYDAVGYSSTSLRRTSSSIWGAHSK